MEQRIEKFQILDGTMLKLIAMISMVIDHIGAVFCPQQEWMRMVGRIAMPVFAFCVAEGYFHTRSRGKYLLRMGIFALISELPFDLGAFGRWYPDHQNIMMTFFLALLGLTAFDRIRGEKDENGKYDPVRSALGFQPVLLLALLALFLKTDYSLFGVIIVFLYHFLRDVPDPIRQFAGVGFVSATRTKGFYAFTFLSLLPILLYNGKRGRGLKWFFYAFYPGHLFVFWLIRHFLLKQ